MKRDVRPRAIAFAVFIAIFLVHAFYLRYLAAQPSEGWSDAGLADGKLGFEAYLRSRDYFVGFSYALGSAFAAWAIAQCVIARRTLGGGAAAGSVTVVGVLMAGGCFLIGCCGSPMLPIYISLFGAKVLGVAKPIMAGITVLAVSCAYWCLARRIRQSGCFDECRKPGGITVNPVDGSRS